MLYTPNSLDFNKHNSNWIHMLTHIHTFNLIGSIPSNITQISRYISFPSYTHVYKANPHFDMNHTIQICLLTSHHIHILSHNNYTLLTHTTTLKITVLQLSPTTGIFVLENRVTKEEKSTPKFHIPCYKAKIQICFSFRRLQLRFVPLKLKG